MSGTQVLRGGSVTTMAQVAADEYLPNRGVFLAQIMGRDGGHPFGLYHGRIDPGCQIARERHDAASKTLVILKGEACALVADHEHFLREGQVLHVDTGVHHGLRNVGKDVLEFLLIGHPDF